MAYKWSEERYLKDSIPSSGRGDDAAGGDLVLSGGASTGDADGGSVVLQTATAGSAGDDVNEPTVRAELDSNGVLWLAEVEDAPTTGKSNMIGLFIEGGALKYIKDNDDVKVVDATDA